MLVRAIACLLVAAGCSASPSATDEAPTVAALTGDDAGVADAARARVADSSEPEDPPEQLCLLSGPPKTTSADTLVYADEFNGTSVDDKKWTLSTHKRGSDNVLNRMAPENATVHDGSLVIVSDRAPSDPTYAYHSGLLDSLGKYARTYGKVELRARFPFAAGVWFAMWGRAWFASFPEIDIEILNKGSVGHSQLYFVNHWAAAPLPPDERRSYKMFEDIDLTQFHTYTVLWKPGLLEWAVDGVPKMQSTGQGVPTLPVYWMINGYVGGWAGPPNATTAFPVTFDVDYMRVYRVDGLIADPAIKVANTSSKLRKVDFIDVAVANFDEACAHAEMYDGGTLVHTTSTAPYRFKVSRLATGSHQLKFVVTDGVRQATTTFDAQIQ